MERRIQKDTVRNQQGEWRVSTIRTDAGGADVARSPLSPFSSADYQDETPWPFETMVFKGGSTGYYHEAYATLKEAKAGHDRIVVALAANRLEIGKGVTGPFGTPSLTAEEWHARHGQHSTRSDAESALLSTD